MVARVMGPSRTESWSAHVLLFACIHVAHPYNFCASRDLCFFPSRDFLEMPSPSPLPLHPTP